MKSNDVVIYRVRDGRRFFYYAVFSNGLEDEVTAEEVCDDEA